jgi:putative membrane protein
MLSDEDQTRINVAIAEAERGTSGEIVVMVDRAASSYRTLPLVFALVLALLVPWPLVSFTEFSAQRIFMWQWGIAIVLVLLCQWQGASGRFVPRFIKRRRAHDVAIREFMARGLTRTSGRTGVLIYVALAERYAEVVTDTGISDKIEASIWRPVIEPLLRASRAGDLAGGLVFAVNEVGKLLAVHAPALGDNPDELPNKVILL